MQINFPKNTRFANSPPRISYCIILIVITIIAYGLFTNESVNNDPTKKGVDLECQKAIVVRIHAGEGYYEAANKELRHRGYPTQSIFNWRLPFLALFLGALPGIEIGCWIGFALALVALLLWIQGLRKEKSFGQTLIGSLLLTGILIYGGIPDLFFAHEFWAGTCIVLSLIAYSRRWVIFSLIAGGIALLIRELSLPFIIVMVIFALLEKRRRESLFWLSLTSGFLFVLGVHFYHIRNLAGNAHLIQNGGWIAFGGWPFVLKTIQLHPFLILNPPWLNAILIPLLLLGLAGWKGELGTRVALLVYTYILVYLFLGQPFNVYWGVMFNMLIPLGALYTWPSFLDLWRSFSKRSTKQIYLLQIRKRS